MRTSCTQTNLTGCGITKHSNGLDGLRGFAALLVFMHHALSFVSYPAWLLPLANSGHLAVDLFFVLSGYVISASWDRTQNLQSYWSARLRRILPLFWFHVAILFGILVPVFYPEWSILGHIPVVMLHIIGLHSLIPLEYPGLYINTPMWTLTIEICFYLILPFIWQWFKKDAIGNLFLLLLLSFAWRVISSGTATPDLWQPFLYQQLPGSLFHFGVGMVLACFKATKDCSTVKWLASAAFIIAIIIAPRMQEASELWYIATAIVSGLLVYGWKNSAMNKLVAKTGRISYSIYLWHFPILFLLHKAGLSAHPVAYLTIAITTALVVAELSFRFIEEPWLKIEKP